MEMLGHKDGIVPAAAGQGTAVDKLWIRLGQAVDNWRAQTVAPQKNKSRPDWLRLWQP